ncbi:MAG TPA: tail fiber domain-containing protein [Saprospiraceae bacterium]|nr:tail fiber domain-containing protein [Saprospiraceae bacterium]
MKFFIVFIIAFTSLYFNVSGQSISISPDGSPPDSSAILDIQSTTKGLLIPRMTQEQRDSIILPVFGLTIFQTDGIPGMYYYDGSAWTSVGASIPVGDWPQNGDDIYNGNSGNIGIGTEIPEGKLHIKGSVDASELIIEASEGQSNNQPMIRLRKSDGADLMWIHTDNKYNSFVGLEAGGLNNAAAGAIDNTFIGAQSGYQNVSGHQNTGIGRATLWSNTTGQFNTASGCFALFSNVEGFYNTAMGYEASLYNVGGSYNTSLGSKALRWGVNSYFNTAIGSEALYSNVGNYNVAVGVQSLFYNIAGFQNTALGYNALFFNTNASNNTAVGSEALYKQSFNPSYSWISDNTAVGYKALYSNQPVSEETGVSNTAIGASALSANTIGYDNTGIGAGALYTNVSGDRNTAVGRQALFYNTTGDDNTSLGYKSLRNNTNGFLNVASGINALYENTTGKYNCAYGALSLMDNLSGNSNVAIGYSALFVNTTGFHNTAIGPGALYWNLTGNNNIAVGDNSGCSQSSSNLINTISIGNGGYFNTASNQDFIGNLSTAWIGGQTTWYTYASDARVKNNVEEDVKGLDFISRLRPVTYNLDITAMREITGNSDTEDYSEKYDIEKIKQSGFLAQEVEQAANASGYNFNGYTTPKKNTELYTMSYSLFVVPLVKATQELNAKVEQLGEENQLLKTMIADLLARMESLEKKSD